MIEVWAQTAMWLGLAPVATLLSIWLKVATALSEIVVGTIMQLIIGTIAGGILLAVDDSAINWESRASWLAGVAMSTTSVAMVYAVMLEFGLNRTDYGKTLLAACLT